MKRIVILVLLSVACTISGLATTVLKKVNVEDLTADAQRIFYGKCIAADSGRDTNGLPCAIYTFEVTRTLKGDADRRIRIKQFGVTRALNDGTVTHVEGMPQYLVGESYLLFLSEESSLGFTSPQGLGQGAFRSFRDPQTQRIAVENGSKNRSLFNNLRREISGPAREFMMNRDEERPLFLDDFLALVSKLLNK